MICRSFLIHRQEKSRVKGSPPRPEKTRKTLMTRNIGCGRERSVSVPMTSENVVANRGKKKYTKLS